MRYGLVLLTSLLIIGCQSVAPDSQVQKTVIHDKQEAKLLRGRHLFTDRGMLSSGSKLSGYRYLDLVNIRNDNGTYRVSGKHEIYWRNGPPKLLESGGYIKIDGVITEINKKSFLFEGKMIEKKISHQKNADDYLKCRNSGPVKFIRKKDRATYMISELVNHRYEIWQNTRENITCNQELDSITAEIMVSRFAGKPPSGDARRLDER